MLESTEVRIVRKAPRKVGRSLTGVAVPFNTLSLDLGGFREKFAPGAFDGWIRDKGDVIARSGHNSDPGNVLGRRSAGTLDVRAEPEGLAFFLELPDTTRAADLAKLIDRGDIAGVSIEFRAIDDQWDFAGGVPVRTVTVAELRGLAMVDDPAYMQTDVALRSRDAARKSCARDVATRARLDGLRSKSKAR